MKKHFQVLQMIQLMVSIRIGDWQPDPRFITEQIDPNTVIANGYNALGIDNLDEYAFMKMIISFGTPTLPS